MFKKTCTCDNFIGRKIALFAGPFLPWSMNDITVSIAVETKICDYGDLYDLFAMQIHHKNHDSSSRLVINFIEIPRSAK